MRKLIAVAMIKDNMENFKILYDYVDIYKGCLSCWSVKQLIDQTESSKEMGYEKFLSYKQNFNCVLKTKEEQALKCPCMECVVKTMCKKPCEKRKKLPLSEKFL